MFEIAREILWVKDSGLSWRCIAYRERKEPEKGENTHLEDVDEEVGVVASASSPVWAYSGGATTTYEHTKSTGKFVSRSASALKDAHKIESALTGFGANSNRLLNMYG